MKANHHRQTSKRSIFGSGASWEGQTLRISLWCIANLNLSSFALHLFQNSRKTGKDLNSNHWYYELSLSLICMHDLLDRLESMVAGKWSWKLSIRGVNFKRGMIQSAWVSTWAIWKTRQKCTQANTLRFWKLNRYQETAWGWA